jgi:hypothetical protein
MLSFVMLHCVVLVSVLRLLVTANVFPSSPIFVTLMMEAMRSPDTSDLTITHRNIPEDDVLHISRRKNLKSYRALNGWAL